MEELITFDDVLIEPTWTTINSRKDVNTETFLAKDIKLTLPVISANMDTVTEVAMAKAIKQNGGIGALHRFCSIEDNVKAFKESECNPIVSIGLGKKELERAEALFKAGATNFLIDVANGASEHVANQACYLHDMIGYNGSIIVGNFATKETILTFLKHAPFVDAFKVGIGGGSACTTRVKTGIGVPTLASVIDCVKTGQDIIADGGIKSAGDVAKSLAAGAKAVMLGGMLAGTEETPGNIILEGDPKTCPGYKKYRGSASLESYKAQGKTGEYRTAEGESFLVEYKGSVKNVLQDIEGGIRSAMSYTNSRTLEEFRKNSKFIKVSINAAKENQAHGKQ